jgi:hypothetical protein
VQPELPKHASLTSVLAEPGGRVLAGGYQPGARKMQVPLAASWSGRSWRVVTLPGVASAGAAVTDLAPDGTGAWATIYTGGATPDRLWRLAGRIWSPVRPAFARRLWILTQLAAVPHTGATWAAGAIKAGQGAAGVIAVAGQAPR